MCCVLLCPMRAISSHPSSPLIRGSASKRICQKAMIQVDAKLQIHVRKTASAVFMHARDSDWSVAQVTARLQALLWGPPGSEGYIRPGQRGQSY
eukprot:2948407-Prymnesium_polylepis.1